MIESDRSDPPEALLQAEYERVVSLLREQTGRDFSRYKQKTVLRRVRRRMQLRHSDDLDSYLQEVATDTTEACVLADYILIRVSSFFRNPEVWAQLAASVIPQLFEAEDPEVGIRAWCAGCATGEEAYSLGMLLLEEADRRGSAARIRVLGSDLHRGAVASASAGFFRDDVARAVGPERLRRFFQEEPGGYRVRPELRGLMQFSVYDVLAERPFSGLDLVVCRNVLIYLRAEVQTGVMLALHGALRADGILVLGTSETVTGAELFKVESKRHAIFRAR